MDNLFLSVMEISASVSLVILLLILLGPLLGRRYGAKWCYWIWIVIALRLVIPWNISLQSPQLTINIPPRLTAPIATDAGILINLPASENPSGAMFTPLGILAAMWLSGCLVFLLAHFISYLHYKKQLTTSGNTISDAGTLRLLMQLTSELHIKRSPRLLESSEASSPMMIGFLHPVLVLPTHAYGQEELYFIFKHELIHLRRGDVCFKLLFLFANGLHWFNPIAYLMSREAAVAMELSCDEAVVSGTSHAVRKAYTETLYSALGKQTKKKSTLSTQFYGGTKIMKKRFQSILNKTPKRNGLPVFLCMITLTLLFTALSGCSASEPGSSERANREGKEQSGTQTLETLETLGTLAPLPSESETQEPPSASDTKAELSADAREIQRVAEAFATAYFSKDTEEMKQYLTDPFEWDVEVYDDEETPSSLLLKGLSAVGDEADGSTRTVSLKFKSSPQSDSFLYLTIELIKQEGSWKIYFYGLEG